jgi:hypothetical protein
MPGGTASVGAQCTVPNSRYLFFFGGLGFFALASLAGVAVALFLRDLLSRLWQQAGMLLGPLIRAMSCVSCAAARSMLAWSVLGEVQIRQSATAAASSAGAVGVVRDTVGVVTVAVAGGPPLAAVCEGFGAARFPGASPVWGLDGVGVGAAGIEGEGWLGCG